MYYFIVNPQAQSGRGAVVWKRIRRVMEKKGLPFKALFTEYAGHATELARHAAERNEEKKIIVAMGGDGTISEVMGGIWDHEDITFAYIPIGSGNDFAKTLGISSNWKEALKGILKEEHHIGLHPGRVEFDGTVRHFGGSMGIGFDAAVCDSVERLRFKALFNRLGVGKFTYLGAAIKLLITSSCDKMKIRLDGKEIRQFNHVLFMCGLKGKYEGGGFKFTPDGEMDDPYIHLCMADSIPVLGRFKLLPKAAVGKHVGEAGVHMMNCQKVEIISSKPKFVHVDGEVLGQAKKVTVSLEKTVIPMVY